MSLLAFRTVVTAASSDHDTLDRRLTDQTGLSFTAVDAVLELEEAFFSIGVNVVGNGGTAECDRFLQNLLHREEKLA